MPTLRARHSAALIAGLALAGGALACSEPTGPLSGALVSGAVAIPAWSADGREIYYTDRAAPAGHFVFTLHAVTVSSGAVRTLASATGTNTGGELVVAPPTGGYVFFTAGADIGPHYLIYRVPTAGGQLDTIATDSRWPWFQVSNDGRRMAYHGGFDVVGPGGADTLKVVDATRRLGPIIRAVAIASSQVAIWSFAPDGSSFVYSSGGAKLFDIATGASTLLYSAPPSPAPGAHETVAGSVWWDGTHPHLLVAAWTDKQGPTSIYDLDGLTGVRTLIGTVPFAERAPWTMAWSPDGSRAAVWVSTRSFNCSVEGCSYDGRLYLLTKGGASAQVVFDTEGAAASPTWTAFSPDGRSVAAVIWSSLYIVPL